MAIKTPNVSGFWYISAGSMAGLTSEIGFICRYECLLGPVRIELHRTESGALYVHTWARRWRQWRLERSIQIVGPSDGTTPRVEWNAVGTWLADYMAATATVHGSWLLILRKRLLA
jgi:hypothetical protein